MAPHPSTLVWKTPWTEEPDRLQSMGSRRVRHDWATSFSLFTFMHWRRKWQPTPVLLPGESHGGRSLVGRSPWGHKELDMTEWLHSLTLSFIFLSDCWLDYLKPAAQERLNTQQQSSRLMSMEPQASKNWKQAFHSQLLQEQTRGRLSVVPALWISSPLDQSWWLKMGEFYHGLPAHT